MPVRLDFEFAIEADFFFTGRCPIALMEEIARAKADLFNALTPNPIAPDMLTVERAFAVEGRIFNVICAADREQRTERRLRVIWIEERIRVEGE